MELMLNSLGFIIGFIAFILLLALTILFILENVRKLIDYSVTKIYNKGYEAGKTLIRYELKDKAWWCSEDKPTMTVLQEILDKDTYDLREQWRKDRTTILYP